MANNQYVNKVIYGDLTLIDLTGDTVAAASMLSGITAHNAAGATITGTIPSRDVLDVSIYWNENGSYCTEFPTGYYPRLVMASNGIKLYPPSSGTRSFYIDFPNSATPVTDGWTRITFSVDSNGNSDITDDTIPASGVSF